MADSFVILQWMSLTNSPVSGYFFFKFFYYLGTILILTALGLKAAILWRTVPVTVAFVIWMFTKVSCRFQNMVCSFLKANGNPVLFWSHCGNALGGIPEAAAGLPGLGLKKQLLLALSKSYLPHLVTAGASAVVVDYVIKDVIPIHPVLKHSIDSGYSAFKGTSIELYNPLAPRESSLVTRAILGSSEFDKIDSIKVNTFNAKEIILRAEDYSPKK